MTDLPFHVGELAESRTFKSGFRGAWFRCKIRGIRMKSGAVSHLLEYFDYPDQKLGWIISYQINKSKGFNRELMLRPSFPTVYHEDENFDVNIISEVIVIVDNEWKVGDLVDWYTDGCYWSGTVTKILGNDKVKIDLLPPPLGEGSTYDALSKDLRPTLDWCPLKGWTVPTPMGDGCGRPCARIVYPANSGGVANIHAMDGSVKVSQPLSQKFEGILDCPERSIVRRKQCNIPSNSVDIDESDKKIGRTVSRSPITDASIENTEMATICGGCDEYPRENMRSNKSLCLNSMSSNTIEAAILDLEELVNRIKWLRDVLNLGVPLSGTKQQSWEFAQHHAPSK